MKDLLILIAHLLTTITKLLAPGGARAIIDDHLLMKQQLLISNRLRKRAPRLTPLDRFLLGFCSLFLIHRRIQQAAVIARPSTLLKFHPLLKQRQFRLLMRLLEKQILAERFLKGDHSCSCRIEMMQLTLQISANLSANQSGVWSLY